MFDHADTMDAPKVTDSKLANSALIDQVNAERKASPSNKNLDQQQGSDTHVNAVFGALTIVGNDAQPADAQVGSSANNVKGDSATNTVKGDSPAAQPKSAEFPVDQPAQQLDQAALDKIQTNKGVNKERNELENNITKLEKAHPEQMKQLEAMRDNMEAFEERAASQKPPLTLKKCRSSTMKSIMSWK